MCNQGTYSAAYIFCGATTALRLYFARHYNFHGNTTCFAYLLRIFLFIYLYMVLIYSSAFSTQLVI